MGLLSLGVSRGVSSKCSINEIITHLEGPENRHFQDTHETFSEELICPPQQPKSSQFRTAPSYSDLVPDPTGSLAIEPCVLDTVTVKAV